jgi:hypothetical protein
VLQQLRQQLLQFARLGVSLPSELRHPVSISDARAILQERQANREPNFLESARRLIYANPNSPYLRLLQRAGCTFADLQQGVQSRGIEATLTALRDAGVCVALEEFKRQVPIVRGDLELSPAETDFDNALMLGGAIEGTTSGSRSQPSRVMYTWPFIAEEAAHEQVLYAQHGVQDAPTALWYPAPPGMAGVHNLLMDVKRGYAPMRWFSQIDPARTDVSMATRLALPAMRAGARLAGVRVPSPEFADADRVDVVLDWMRGRCVLRTFASSAVRLAERALALRRDLSGAVMFVGGEPLTDARRAVIESTGARVFARYVTTESGLVGASCDQRASTDDMHVYTDRVAVIDGVDGTMVTTLSLHTGKVLFNTVLGDTATFTTRDCSCEFGRLGFRARLTNVRSQQRFTVEGMTVMASDFEAALDEAISALKLRRDRIQYRRESGASGLERLVLVVPTTEPAADDAMLGELYAGMSRRGPALTLAADVWHRSGTVQVRREDVRGSSSGKSSMRAASVPAPRA